MSTPRCRRNVRMALARVITRAATVLPCAAALLAASSAAFVGACSSTPTRYHSLTQIERASGQPSTSGAIVCTADSAAPVSTEPVGSILLAHVAVPAEADRMQLVLHQTPTRLAVYETERWAAPLADQVSAILIGNLRTALPNAGITSDPLLTGTGTTVQLYVDIEELDALAGKEAIVRAQWKLSVKGNTASRTGSCSARQPLHSTNLDELVLAWSRALADISSALAAHL